jgi:hypothetical protein
MPEPEPPNEGVEKVSCDIARVMSVVQDGGVVIVEDVQFAMARYKAIDRFSKFLPVVLSEQLLFGTSDKGDAII